MAVQCKTQQTAEGNGRGFTNCCPRSVGLLAGICRLKVWWLSGRASHSGARCPGLETYLCRVVSLSKTLYSPKVLVIPRKRWLRLDMTEKLLTGKLNLNTGLGGSGHK